MTMTVQVVRIYLTEGDKLINAVINYLHDEMKVKGVTVFRAISGYGQSGVAHSSQILSLSFNLPLVIEFFDSKEKVVNVLPHLKQLVGEHHIIHWSAQVE